MCFFSFCRTRINRASYVLKIENNDMHKFITYIACDTKNIGGFIFFLK